MFDRATALASLGNESRDPDPADAFDADAARTRIMHTLYVGAHGVRVALREHLWDLRWAATRIQPGDSHGIALAQDAAHRLAAFEQLAGAHAGNHPRRATPGDQVDSGTVRLEQALVGWDIQAHRTLAAAPTPGNLLLASRVQASITSAGIAVLDAGVRSGHVDKDAHQHRLAPAIDQAQTAWTQAAVRWAELTHPTNRTDRHLVHAANELHATVRELTQEGTAWARPEVIASRVDIGAATRSLQQALSAAVDVAYLTRNIAATDQDLTGPAQTLLRRVNAEYLPVAQLGEDVVWVAASDVHANRIVPVPEPVRAGLVAAGDAVVRTANAAMYAAACLDRTPEEPACKARASTPPTRRPEDRMPSPAPTLRCSPRPL